MFVDSPCWSDTINIKDKDERMTKTLTTDKILFNNIDKPR